MKESNGTAPIANRIGLNLKVRMNQAAVVAPALKELHHTDC